MEIFSFAAGTSNLVYGKGNSNNGSNDCKYIQKMLAVFATPAADDNDATYAAISKNENTDDLATISTAQSVAKSVMIVGYGGEAT